MKLGASQSIVQMILVNIIMRCPTSRLLYARPIMETALTVLLRALKRWHGSCTNTGAMAALRGGSMTDRQGTRGSGLWLWLGCGGGGGAGVGWEAGRGGRRRGSLLGCVRLCDHAATISSSTVHQIQFIDSGWIILCRDGYPQCKL